jgi:hypothetical protein
LDVLNSDVVIVEKLPKLSNDDACIIASNVVDTIKDTVCSGVNMTESADDTDVSFSVCTSVVDISDVDNSGLRNSLSDFTKDKGELWNVLSEIVEVIENNCGWWKLSSTAAEKDEDVMRTTLSKDIGCLVCNDEEIDFIGSLDTMEDIKRSVLFNPFSVVAYSDTAVVNGVNDETDFDSSSLFMLIYGLGKVVEYE